MSWGRKPSSGQQLTKVKRNWPLSSFLKSQVANCECLIKKSWTGDITTTYPRCRPINSTKKWHNREKKSWPTLLRSGGGHIYIFSSREPDQLWRAQLPYTTPGREGQMRENRRFIVLWPAYHVNQRWMTTTHGIFVVNRFSFYSDQYRFLQKRKGVENRIEKYNSCLLTTTATIFAVAKVIPIVC